MRGKLFSWAAAVFLVAQPGFAQSDDQTAQEKPIPFAELPEAAHDAALRYLGRQPSEAKVILGTNPLQYELAGKSKDNRDMTVRVLGDGTIMEIGNARKGSVSGK